jgi:hypothetical protein
VSEINHPTTPVAPATGPAAVPASGDAAVDAYRRAVAAKPTNLAENPIGAMATVADRIAKTAGNLVKGSATAGQATGANGVTAEMQSAEQELVKANAAAKANPGSMQAKQRQAVAAARLLAAMGSLPANDPRKVRVATFLVNLGAQLGRAGLPLTVPGMDMRGVLRLAAAITSRFGDAAAMQNAFSLESILRASVEGSSPEALQLRDQLLEKFGITSPAAQMIKNGWKFRVANPGELPSMRVDTRELVLSASQENPSLGVLARAFWIDAQLRAPGDRENFIREFVRLSNQGSMAMLDRRYKEYRRMAKAELAHNRAMSAVGSSPGTPVVTGGPRQEDDEAADMFAASALWARTDGAGQALPDGMRGLLSRFLAA